MGNSLERALLGGSDASATTGWTDGKPWEAAWGELRWEQGTRKRRQGGRRETAAPVGGSDTSATTWWTDGKPWEIALGGRERHGSDCRVDRRGKRGK